jgi:multimeric flavodoxin WrbA
MYNKVGGAIAVGGARSGGQEFTIARINGFYATWGVLPVNLGSPGFTGSTGWSVDGTYEKLTGDDIAAGEARLLGERIAMTVNKMGAD